MIAPFAPLQTSLTGNHSRPYCQPPICLQHLTAANGQLESLCGPFVTSPKAVADRITGQHTETLTHGDITTGPTLQADATETYTRTTQTIAGESQVKLKVSWLPAVC